MPRKLFCEISPLTYRISACKCRIIRRIHDLPHRSSFACTRSQILLPTVIYAQKSLIRRKLGNVDLQLQENKAVNLALTAPKISGILIRPGETFSFWRLVGDCREKDGYQTGLIISNGKPDKGIGGGMCQFTNLIHWIILHSPLTITEHHHHDGLDLFPDYNRQIPFGTGTSILYNYRDYRFRNDTDQIFQLIVSTNEKYLCGELRAEHPLKVKYHIHAEDEKFIRENGEIFRTGKIYRQLYDSATGNLLEKTLIKENHAKVLYDLDPAKISG